MVKLWLWITVLKNLVIKSIFCNQIFIEDRATVMLVTFWYWRLTAGDNFIMFATELRSWWHLVDVGDQNGQTRHQHLKIFTNTFRLQYPSPTSMKPKDWPRSIPILLDENVFENTNFICVSFDKNDASSANSK